MTKPERIGFDSATERELYALAFYSHIRLITGVLAACSGVVCGSREEYSSECSAYLKHNLADRIDIFERALPETQLDLYLCSMDVHPPLTGFAYRFADGGPANVPVLLQRLRVTENERDQTRLILVVEVMAAEGYLQRRSDILAEIKNIVSTMQVERYRKEAQEGVQRIERALRVRAAPRG